MRTLAHDYRKYLSDFTIVFVAYCIAGKLGQATTSIRSSNLGPVWPAYGVALASVLLCGYRIWPSVFLAAFVVAFSSPEPVLTALGQGAGATLGALTGTFLLRRIARFDNSLCRLRDAFAVVLLGAMCSAIVSATIGTLVLHGTQIQAYSGLASSWLIYWLGDSTGVLLVTPLALTFPSLWKVRGWRRVGELLLLLLILTVASAVVFAELPIMPVRMLAFAVLPLVIWAAIRFGVSGAALSIFLVATVATVETQLGSGSFARNTPFVNGVQLDAFFALLSLTGLTFAALYAEREAAERERAESLRQQVAMEVHLQDEELLRGSEERMRLAQQVARIGTFEWNIRTGVNTWTRELEAMYGLPPGGFAGTQAAFEELVHPDDRRRVIELAEASLKTGQASDGEWRVVWPDGSVHWVAASWRVFMNESNAPARMIGVNIDITDRKRVEEALLGVNRRLIEAQEKERRRIARELHDDINQRLAMLAVELEQLQLDPSDLDSRVSELRKRMGEISVDVQALSHDLHSSKLEYLGVVAGIRSWCKEIADRQKVRIDFHSDVSSVLPLEIGLPLFRILQEAVQNSIKHSGVRRLEVQLHQAGNEIHSTIRDYGRGFDVEAAMQGKGLGLTSMRERVRLMNGTITIDSTPMYGAVINISVPLGSERNSRRVAV